MDYSVPKLFCAANREKWREKGVLGSIFFKILPLFRDFFVSLPLFYNIRIWHIAVVL